MPNRHHQPVITIDGTSASGKSTLSEQLAERYGAQRLEYSLFFRLIGLHMLEQGFNPEKGAIVTDADKQEAATYARSLTWDSIQQLKNDPRLRSIDVSRAAPFFSGLREVLDSTDAVIETLVDASREKPVIVEGRTIGKYVYPAADVKLYVDADLPLRGARRAADLRLKGRNETDEQVAADLAERDRQDQTRAYQPTGFDAAIHHRIDTSHRSIASNLTEAMQYIEAARPELGIRRTSIENSNRRSV